MKMIKHKKTQHALTLTANKAKLASYFSNFRKVKSTCIGTYTENKTKLTCYLSIIL